MTEWKGINITDGTGQDDRPSPALAPGYINVDELVFEELLAMAAEFASVINFYNLKNEVEGNWGEMFSADEAVIMAMISSTSLKRLESEFLSIPAHNIDKLVSFLLGLAKKIDFWHARLSASHHNTGEALANKIAVIIDERLVVELHKLAGTVSRTSKHAETLLAGFSQFGSVWRVPKTAPGETFSKSDSDSNPGSNPRSDPRSDIDGFDNVADVNRQLRSSFYVFFNAISYLKTITPIFLQQSLGSQQHNPAVGLYIVFLKLYEKAQRKLNTFTQRHLDFYYRQILRAKNKQQLSESVYLLFEPQAGGGNAFIEKGSEFSAGKDEFLNDIVFSADSSLVVTDAKVESLAMLQLEHDKLVSPESELGYVTRMKSALRPVPEPDSGEEQEKSRSLFDAEQLVDDLGGSTDARIGFSIASPLLLLKEGIRTIELSIEFESVVKHDVDTMVSHLLEADSDKQFSHLLGTLLARYLLTDRGCFTPEHKHLITTKADAVLPKALANDIAVLLRQDWQGLFYKLFKKVFSIRLTTEQGWLDVEDYIVTPRPRSVANNTLGLNLQLTLGQEAAPVVGYAEDIHGGELQTTLPLLQCQISPQANFYPYSLFRDLVIASLQIDVDVKGIRNLLAYNHHGQLDPSKPFHPFGPLPSSNSYFIFGNYEIAGKPLTDLRVNLDWGELPRDAGGFEEHYRGYETQYSNSIFKGEFAALADGSWLPYGGAASTCVNLFETEESSDRLAAGKAMTVDVLDYANPVDANIPEREFQYGLSARNGFFRLSLAAPESAFGHAEYPGLLSKVLTANARLKKPKQPPNPPYLPTLNRMSLDYKASSIINPAVRSEENGSLQERIIHLHPLGVETTYPVVTGKPCFFVPQYQHAGHLFIGISARALSGVVNLFFSISEAPEEDRGVADEKMSWFYLASNNWKALAAQRVLSDSTNGLLSSGIVTLDLPKDINRDNTILSRELYWVRVSSQNSDRAFRRVVGVRTHALQLTRKVSADGVTHNPLPDTGEWSTMTAIPALGNISQAGAPFGGRPQESSAALKTRTAERLRHKNRAQVPWDYERIILERFPDVHKVKCFSNISSVENTIKPGNVLIAVVPKSRSATGETCTRVMMSAERLDQIKACVSGLCSPFAEIEVRNPVYETVQVRCTVKFIDGVSDGVNINRLNQEISDYICPWNNKGYKVRFGWSIRQKDVESHIRSLAYVEFVTNFSMLHITVDDDENYSLFDTAKDGEDYGVVIRPRYPWSLAIPARRHFIETMRTARSVKAEITGVDELEVGGTFIISGNSNYGEEE